MTELRYHLSDNIAAALSPPLRVLLARIAREAAAQPAAIWLVGGVVRDLLLGEPITHDLDLAVEGDTPVLAGALANALNGQVSAQHHAFGTATVQVQLDEHGPLTIDLARTRSEHYPRPAALPVVQPASITDDLARRDFSINAMAVRVREQQDQPVLTHPLDPFQGQRDLQAGVLRVLHDQSFRDDPTRILRGLRLAARLNLPFEPHTRELLGAALAHNLLEATTPDRIRAELCLALEEPRPGAVLDLADDLGITSHIYAPLAQASPTQRAQAARPDLPPLARAGVLTYHLTADEREALIARYRLSNDTARVLREVGRLHEQIAELRQPHMPNSQLDRLLQPYGHPALDVVRYIHIDVVSDRITHYLANLRPTAPLLDGHALQRLGVPPGKRLGALLRDLRAARLDGLVQTREDEAAWVQQQLSADE